MMIDDVMYVIIPIANTAARERATRKQIEEPIAPVAVPFFQLQDA